MQVRIKRVYDEPLSSDGLRVLVDRLWPRGLTKEKAKVDVWVKDIAPSTQLRQWFNHESTKWSEFKKRYTSEIKKNPARPQLKELIDKGKLTLVYSAKDAEHNNAVALKEFFEKEQA